MIGEVVEQFRIEECLGGGSYGMTYRATNLQLGGDVALKRIPHDEGAIEEARALVQIDHPHVVKVMDVVEDYDGHDYIVMELVDGQTLHDWLERGKVPPPVWWGVLRKLLSALQEVHARGMVHADIKPLNIVLRGGLYSQPVLVDFGLASRPGLAYSAVGTKGYRPPEASEGAMSAPGDLFSLAVISHEALFGEYPEEGLEHREKMREQLQAEGGRFCNAIARALNEDEFARPQNALEFVGEMVHADRPNHEGGSSFTERPTGTGTDLPNKNEESARHTRTAHDQPAWTGDSKDTLTAVKKAIAIQTKLHSDSIGLLVPDAVSSGTGANQVGRLRSAWEEHSWYDRLDDPERNAADEELRELERLNGMPSGTLALRDGFEGYDVYVGETTSVHVDYEATLASFRRDLETDCELPNNSIRLLGAAQEYEGRRQIGTVLRRWEALGWSVRPPTVVPNTIDDSLSVKEAIQDIEDSSGLPHGSVCLCKPDWGIYSMNTRIGVVRNDYGIFE